MAAGNQAAGASNIPMITHLLELGLEINGLDDIQGPYSLGTPLHHAIHHGAVDSARFLLQKGADPHKKNQWGYSAAESAIRSGNTKFLTMFGVRR